MPENYRQHREWTGCILYLIKRPTPGSWKASERGTDLGSAIEQLSPKSSQKLHVYSFYCKLMPPTYLSKAHDKDGQRCYDSPATCGGYCSEALRCRLKCFFTKLFKIMWVWCFPCGPTVSVEMHLLLNSLERGVSFLYMSRIIAIVNVALRIYWLERNYCSI